MRAQEFIEPYYRSIPQQELDTGPMGIDMSEARAWDSRFGEAIYDYFRDGVSDIQANEALVSQYIAWMPEYTSQALALAKHIDDTTRTMSDTTLHHALNDRMLELLDPVLFNEWRPSATNRNYYLNVSQDKLALLGLDYYHERQRLIQSQKHDYDYFHKKLAPIRGRIEGHANNIDTAIVLLEALRHRPDTTVMPSPYQFSHSSKPGINSNFLVTSTAGNVVGVRTRSKIHKNQHATYDKNRLVLVDGQLDMNNVLYRQIDARSYRTIGWAGIISAQRVKDIPTQGSREEALRSYFNLNPKATRREIRRLQSEAHELVGHIRPQLKHASKIIGERVLAHL